MPVQSTKLKKNLHNFLNQTMRKKEPNNSHIHTYIHTYIHIKEKQQKKNKSRSERYGCIARSIYSEIESTYGVMLNTHPWE